MATGSLRWRDRVQRSSAALAPTDTVRALARPSRMRWATLSASIQTYALADCGSHMSLGAVSPLP